MNNHDNSHLKDNPKLGLSLKPLVPPVPAPHLLHSREPSTRHRPLQLALAVHAPRFRYTPQGVLSLVPAAAINGETASRSLFSLFSKCRGVCMSPEARKGWWEPGTTTGESAAGADSLLPPSSHCQYCLYLPNSPLAPQWHPLSP